MKKVIMCLRDRAAQAFIQPFTTPRVELAVRSLQNTLASQKTEMNQFPDDYELYELGTFDDNSGEFEVLPRPKLITTAREQMPKAYEAQRNENTVYTNGAENHTSGNR